MTHHDKARELVELVRAALTFCNAAAGEGLGIDGMSPEDFLMDYSSATGFTDWDRFGDHGADLITALAEENQRLREAVAEEWREIEQAHQPRLADGYTAVRISKPGFWLVKGPGPRRPVQRGGQP